jgi:hypothetical protein
MQPIAEHLRRWIALLTATDAAAHPAGTETAAEAVQTAAAAAMEDWTFQSSRDEDGSISLDMSGFLIAQAIFARYLLVQLARATNRTEDEVLAELGHWAASYTDDEAPPPE